MPPWHFVDFNVSASSPFIKLSFSSSSSCSCLIRTFSLRFPSEEPARTHFQPPPVLAIDSKTSAVMLPRIALTALAAALGTHAIPQAATTSQSAASSTSSSSSASTSGKACNNSPSLCSRQYNNVTYMGAHDSAFVKGSGSGNSLAINQNKNATAALDAGLRLLQAQVHKPNSTLELCHTTCDLFDAGGLEPFLSSVATWMAAHPDDVVTLLLVNSDKAPASDFASVFDAAGISKMAYKPATADRSATWPTLESMISQNQRLVTWVTNMDYSSATPYLLPEFDFVFETPYEVTQLTGFNCTVDRPSKAKPAATALSSGFLSLVNHFKYQTVIGSVLSPDSSTIDVVNSAATSADGNLGKHLQTCETEWSKAPNYVLVDFWEEGDPVAALDTMNGVKDATGRTNATTSESAAAVNSPIGGLVAFVCAALVFL